MLTSGRAGSVQLQVSGPFKKGFDSGVDVVHRVRQPRHLSDRFFFLPLGGVPVVHRPRHRRRRHDRRVVYAGGSDRLVDVEQPVVGEAGLGLPSQTRGGVRTEVPVGGVGGGRSCRPRQRASNDSPADAWLALASSVNEVEKPRLGLLTGAHLMASGMRPGPHFKPVLAAAVEAQDKRRV